MKQFVKYLLIAALAFAWLPLVDAQTGWLPLVKAGGGGGGVTWDYRVNSNAFSGSGGSTTFSVATGTTSSSDIVIVIGAADSSLPDGATITDSGGTPRTMTLAVSSQATTFAPRSIFYMTGFALGATSTIVLTSTGAGMNNPGIIVGVISGSSTPTPTATAQGAFNSNDPSNISITVPSGGIGLVNLSAGVTVSGTWSNATADPSFVRVGTNTLYPAHTATGTGVGITAGFAGLAGSGNDIIAAAWGP